jgi:hypothetical protein
MGLLSRTAKTVANQDARRPFLVLLIERFVSFPRQDLAVTEGHIGEIEVVG